jgi:uncharacterized Fe-S cluster protein YjdI/CDGSH-type Zn-finger protein
MATRDYPGDGVTVHWDSEVCRHSGRCVAALPAVFRPKEKPWIVADAASGDAVVAAVELCPTGALRYSRDAGPAAAADPSPSRPTAAAVVVVTVEADGPNTIVGPVEIRNAAGEVVKRARRVSLCRCGHSENKPFCDGSHERFGFSDPGPAAPASGPSGTR